MFPSHRISTSFKKNSIYNWQKVIILVGTLCANCIPPGNSDTTSTSSQTATSTDTSTASDKTESTKDQMKFHAIHVNSRNSVPRGICTNYSEEISTSGNSPTTTYILGTGPCPATLTIDGKEIGQSETCLVKKLEPLDMQFQTILYGYLQLGDAPAVKIEDLGKNFPKQFCRNEYIARVGKSYASEYPVTGEDEFMIYHQSHMVSGTKNYTGICVALEQEISDGSSPQVDYDSGFGQCTPTLLIGGVNAEKIKVCPAKKLDPLDLRAQNVIYSRQLNADGSVTKWEDLSDAEKAKLCENPLN